MSDKPIPLLETQIKRVDERVQRLCDMQKENIKGTPFENFFPFLKRAWEFVFEDFFRSEQSEVASPTFQARINGKVLSLQSSLVSMQFTTGLLPRYISMPNIPIYNTIAWEIRKDDGDFLSKEKPFGDAPGVGELSSDQMISILRDIIPNMIDCDTIDYPMHLMALVLQMITYNLLTCMSYLGTERDMTHPTINGSVIKASFSNGLKVHDIYISESIAWDDWNDMIRRYKETYGERDGQQS